VGLAGEVRAVPQLAKRLAEAARLGFQRAVASKTESQQAPPGLDVLAVAQLSDALRLLA
jgi:DNA repair protein RadA/Sms